MQALISKIESSQNGWRVSQVEPDDKVFPVADDFFWISCADDVFADQFWYDPVTETIKKIPLAPADQPQPQADGVQQL